MLPPKGVSKRPESQRSYIIDLNFTYMISLSHTSTQDKRVHNLEKDRVFQDKEYILVILG